MGATTFMIEMTGSNAHEAFNKAHQQACYDHGHSGYTGTVAEKNQYTMINLPKDQNPEDFADYLLDTDDDRVSDKWGPAGCIKTEGDRYLFFGWASC